MKISATIITLNEELNIKAACESVAWADEIVVVDSGSTDATPEIAEACGARVITNPWPGFGAQKQFAVDQSKHEWVFSLDADERVSDELKRLMDSLRGKTDHESVTMDPGTRVERLPGDLLHYTLQNAAHHHRMIGERYAPLAARQMFEEGRRTSVLGVAAAGPAAFIRSLILKGGLRDGFAGFTIASFAAHHAFLKHLMLWEKQTADKTDKNNGLR